MGLRQEVARIPAWGWCLAAATSIRVILAGLVPMSAEEAYHWNYAVHLDWSYYDHPPMLAWSIALGRLIFGDTALGVRFVPILFSIGTAVLIARLARRFYGERAAVWAVVLLSIEPAMFLATGAGFPDTPMLFFWTLAMTRAWQALETGQGRWWLAAGAGVGLAMLSKYTACFLPLSIFLYLVFSKRHRKWLATPWPYLACVLAAVVFTPVLAWNWRHDWVSFRFQSVERLQEARGIDPVGAAKFLIQQWLAVLPLILPLAAVALWRAARSPRAEERFLFWMFAPMVATFFAVGWMRSTHVLWPLPAHLGLTVLMSGEALRAEGRVAAFYRKARPWLIGVSGTALVAAVLHSAFFLPWLSPFQGLYGWNEVSVRAREIRSTLPPGSFYIGLGRKYTCASQMAYHLPAPYDVHGWNLLGERGLQYDYWVKPADLAGRDAVIVCEDGHVAEDMLREHFRSLEPAGEVDVAVGRSPVLPTPPVRFLLFRGRGYVPPGAAR